MKLKTKLSKLRHDGYITDAEYAIIINVLNKFSTQQKVEQPCEDAISREEALRIAKSYYHAEYVVDKIRQLPPVIPKTKPCEDCISREEAIRVAEQGQIQGYEWQFKKLCNLPSVTPKQNTRKSIIDADKLDEIIVDAIDASTNKIECQTLRWVLDKISELSSVTPQEQQPCDTPRNNLANTSQDCISRAEVLECAYLLTDDEGITHEVVHADDIRYAAPVTWSGWTPATQPPEPNTAVLLYVRYKSTGRWTYQLGMWNDSKQAWEDWRTPYRLEEEFDVIAWMELPEIYEEDNNEW